MHSSNITIHLFACGKVRLWFGGYASNYASVTEFVQQHGFTLAQWGIRGATILSHVYTAGGA